MSTAPPPPEPPSADPSPAGPGNPGTAPRPGKRGNRWRDWALNLLLILAVFGGVQWWQARPLASGTAPPLAGTALNGQPVDLADYRGAPLLVHFWATWCPVCKAMDGAVAAIDRDWPVITVAMQSGGPGEVRRFLDEAGLRLPAVPDPYGEIAGRWGVHAVPATFVLDGDGRIVYRTVGLSTEPVLRARLWTAEHDSRGE